MLMQIWPHVSFSNIILELLGCICDGHELKQGDDRYIHSVASIAKFFTECLNYSVIYVKDGLVLLFDECY